MPHKGLVFSITKGVFVEVYRRCAREAKPSSKYPGINLFTQIFNCLASSFVVVVAAAVAVVVVVVKKTFLILISVVCSQTLSGPRGTFDLETYRQPLPFAPPRTEVKSVERTANRTR